MNKRLVKAIGVCSALSIGLLLLALFAHERAALAGGQNKQAGAQGRKEKAISAEDQQALEALFKGADSSKYRLRFNNGTQTLGRLKVEMQDLEQVKTYRNPAEAAGFIVLAAKDQSVIYVLAVGGKKVESLIGNEKAAKLNQIMAKYAR
jgi:hypothetical protein